MLGRNLQDQAYNSKERGRILKNMNVKAKRKHMTHLTKSKNNLCTKGHLKQSENSSDQLKKKILETYKTQK